ncbi:MAG: histidine kinase [Candidatus Amulumruptor caecigallinarius]|nr:histidine kinase [Candidatus Amulumruptor caecigallinarius]MCM1396395.1 histidine kinase [Candidatus Amulumruptor caecigallinarius]MCM1453548.1 histidine kinase [bacterium]
MNRVTDKRLESLIYVALWAAAVTLLGLDMLRARSAASLPLVDGAVVWRAVLNVVPLLVLFVVNNYLLIPRLLKRGRYGAYFAAVTVTVALVWACQWGVFTQVIRPADGRLHPGPPGGGPHPLLPLPLFLDVIYDLLIVGVNLAISMIFQHINDSLEREHLMKQHAESRLTYLKAQINPHFYMNMLNNIHGMIELNPSKAQDMVMEMSGLMRYMLYESERREIALSAEAGFIRDYVGLMRERYPEDAVRITLTLPPPTHMAGVRVPPLIFLVFIENAFKHGVSYAEPSFIRVSLSSVDGEVRFHCINSVPRRGESAHAEGIGLANVRQRLTLIYGEAYQLNIQRTESEYTVTLTLPTHETEYPDN